MSYCSLTQKMSIGVVADPVNKRTAESSAKEPLTKRPVNPSVPSNITKLHNDPASLSRHKPPSLSVYKPTKLSDHTANQPSVPNSYTPINQPPVISEKRDAEGGSTTQAKKPETDRRAEKLSCTINQIRMPPKELPQEQPTRNKETLRMNLFQILGTNSSAKQNMDNSKLTSPVVVQDQDPHSKPRQNSDPIETDSENDVETANKPVTRPLARKTAPSTMQSFNFPDETVSPDKMYANAQKLAPKGGLQRKPRQNSVAVESDLEKNRDRGLQSKPRQNSVALESDLEKNKDRSLQSKPRQNSVAVESDLEKNRDRGLQSKPRQNSVTVESDLEKNGETMKKPVTRYPFRKRASARMQNSYSSDETVAPDEFHGQAQDPALVVDPHSKPRKNLDTINTYSKNDGETIKKPVIQSPARKSSTRTHNSDSSDETVAPNEMNANTQEHASKEEPHSKPGQNSNAIDTDEENDGETIKKPVTRSIGRKRALSRSPISNSSDEIFAPDEKHATAQESSTEEKDTEKELYSPSRSLFASTEVSSAEKAYSEDVETSSDELVEKPMLLQSKRSRRQDVDCNDFGPAFPRPTAYSEDVETSSDEFVEKPTLFRNKRGHSQDDDCNDFVPAFTIPTADGNTEDVLMETSARGSEDGLARMVSYLGMALEKVRNKMALATNKRCSDILMSAAEEIHIQLQDVESQIQTDLGKLTSIKASKRKYLETRLQEQQENLRAIHAKYKEDIHKYLQSCSSALEEGLENEHSELKGVTERQKKSHRNLLSQAEATVDNHLTVAQRRIVSVRKLGKRKTHQLKVAIGECLKEELLSQQ